MAGPFEKVTFLLSETEATRLPVIGGEAAFVGRSNVGKSSLLNALCRKDLARVSSTPGRTRTINVFTAGKDRWLVDLPGYGFAKGKREERESWASMVESYLSNRPSLRLVVALVDAKVGPTDLDLQMLDWLEAAHLNWMIVATKSDQVPRSQAEAQRAAIAQGMGVAAADVAWVSSKENWGIGELREKVGAVLRAPSPTP